MNIQKAVMTTDGPAIRFAMPISKVDVQRRLVSGFATLNNVDSHGDIVSAEASRKAFSRFRGNIREMHSPIAVGKMVDFEEQSYYDPFTEKFYDGIYVTAYVSTGAEETWTKVLDGTLTGFSIGGQVIDYETHFDKSDGSAVREITDYALQELSLVDNPANQLANIFSIVKSATNELQVTGIAVDVKTENILYCPADEFIVATKKDSGVCAECGDSLKNIGWVESDNSAKSEVAKSLVSQYHKNTSANLPLEKINDIIEAKATEFFVKGGNTMQKDVVEDKVVEVDETAPVEEEVKVEEPVAEEPAVEENADAPVEEAPAPDFEKMFSNFADDIKKFVAEAQESNNSVLTEVRSELEKSIASQAELGEKVSALESRVEEVSSANSEVAKTIDELASESSIRKSADARGSGAPAEKKSFWGQSFLSVE